MKIVRKQGSSKVVYELTMSELRRAYEEYEHICDVQDILDKIDQDVDEKTNRYHGVPADWLENHVDEIAYLKRKYIDKYGTDWDVAVEDALDDYIDMEWKPQHDIATT